MKTASCVRLFKAVPVSIAGYVLLPCLNITPFQHGFRVNGTAALNIATFHGCQFVSHSQSQIQMSLLFDSSSTLASLFQIPVPFSSHCSHPENMERGRSWVSSQATEIFFNYSSAVTSVVTGITPERSAAMSALDHLGALKLRSTWTEPPAEE